MRWAMAALLAMGLFYLHQHRRHTPPQAPPMPMQLNLPAAPVLSIEEIQRVRNSAADRDPEVRWAAIKLLFAVKDPDTLAVIDKIVSSDPDPEVRRKAVDLLNQGEDRALLPTLIKGLKDPDMGVRISSLKGLGEVGDPAALPWMTEALKDYEPEVKVEALRALGKFQDKRKRQFQVLADKLREDYEAALRRAENANNALGAPTHPPAK